jgi:deoxyhypusine synthase
MQCALLLKNIFSPSEKPPDPYSMKKTFKPADLNKIRTCSLKQRKSLVKRDKLGSPCKPSVSFQGFIDSLPEILAAKDFKEIVQRVIKARQGERVIIWGMGAHVIKVGLSPILIDLMEQGFITCLALNGAGVIHDVEMALMGSTSEDVSAELDSGDFGMSGETASFINGAVARGVKAGYGLGESVGRALLASKFPYVKESIIAAACSRNIPVTVHVAMGTDIIHMHPSCDGAAFGEGSHRDFRLLTDVVGSLQGGAYLNVGSAVILPEVFLKALNVARNLGHAVNNFTTVTMDFIRHYRPLTNVAQRPVMKGGKGFVLVGHHEIMVPLLAAALKQG